MTFDGEAGRPSMIPSGYELDVRAKASVSLARIFARDGSLAASGYAASAQGVFVYDRIVTEEPHRRRGLASAIMMALGCQRSPVDARQALVATRAGRSLYTKLGWVVRSPWTTGVMPSE
ncbi:MAG: GNAT family N-acetyltransferase [Caulobacteraceae bacterium]|nr:GNAT family N-acetyltransferase [Caulobacteraceae bacterium]